MGRVPNSDVMTQGGEVDSGDWFFGIMDEVSSKEDVAPTGLPPMSDAIDPDALIDLIESSDESLKVRFSYASYDIQVTGDGSTTVVKTK